ncbi:MAG TPA: hypothetical protein VK657_01160 [Terriglobales bacterium]|nr:hypothetical protein [Terriglobales bacterium]
MNSMRALDNRERELMEFLNSAAHNLRKILERDPEMSAAEIETIVMKLPLVLRETVSLLQQPDHDMPTICLSFDA